VPPPGKAFAGVHARAAGPQAPAVYTRCTGVRLVLRGPPLANPWV